MFSINMFAVLVVAVLCMCVAPNAAKTPQFPASIERCPAGDTECLATLITALMERAGPAGLPELGVPVMDPLYFGSGTVGQQNSGPVSMNITISKGSIHGWSRMQVTKVVGFERDPHTSPFELHVHVPLDKILGQYDMSAKALLMTVKSTGALNLTLEHLDMIFKFRTTVVKRDDGEEYLHLKSIDLQTHAKKMHVKFENLFSNKAISDNANDLMNQYQEALFAEIHTSYNKGRQTVLEPILRPIFEKFPYRMWFADTAAETPTTPESMTDVE